MKDRLFYLNEFELLRAVNAVSQTYGGTRIGEVGHVEWKKPVWTGRTYRNQWLISAELLDESRGLFGEQDGRPSWSIRLGFCQTNITRAPKGGWAIEVKSDILALCRTVDDVVIAVEAHFGPGHARWRKADMLLTRLEEQAAVIATHAWNMTAHVHADALLYAMEKRTI